MDIVYKYRPLSDEKGRIPKNTLSVLSGNMYFAPPSSFKNNDPEDVRVPISFDGTDGQIKNYLFERFKGGHISESEYEELKLNPQKLKEHINNSSDKKRRDVFGVFCVGKTWDNLHTWRTFGLNSDCVAVGFRCIHDEKLKKDFLPLLKNQSDTGLPFDDISVLYDVKYTDTPIEPFEIITRSYEEYLAFIRNVIITKRTIFEPEDEKRAIILRSHFVQKQDKKGGVDLESFPPGIAEVVFGPQTSERKKTEVMEYMKQYYEYFDFVGFYSTRLQDNTLSRIKIKDGAPL